MLHNLIPANHANVRYANSICTLIQSGVFPNLAYADLIFL